MLWRSVFSNSIHLEILLNEDFVHLVGMRGYSSLDRLRVSSSLEPWSTSTSRGNWICTYTSKPTGIHSKRRDVALSFVSREFRCQFDVRASENRITFPFQKEHLGLESSEWKISIGTSKQVGTLCIVIFVLENSTRIITSPETNIFL